MDFRHLRAFIAVAETSSVTKAAERLHISQPPLSRHIRQLEDELGTPLFVRHRHGVTLTEAGRGLLEKAKVLAEAASEFFDTAGRATRNDSNKIRVGMGWGLWDAVNKVRVEYAKRFTNATIEAMDVYCSDDFNEQLRSRLLDVVFARPPLDAAFLNSTLLYQEPLVAVVSEDSPLASRKSLRIRDLATLPLLLFDRHLLPLVYDKTLELYARANVTPIVIPTPGAGPHNHAGMMLVASGKGTYLCIGIPLTSPQPAGGVAVVPLCEPDATSDVCVAWRKGETSPIVHQFLNCVSQVFPQPKRASAAVRTPSRRAS
jgi:DNA-binding transcriptional LysR family regulator